MQTACRRDSMERKPDCDTVPTASDAVEQQKWRRSGSNRQPPACKAGALPIELRPRKKSRAKSPEPKTDRPLDTELLTLDSSVGVPGLEPGTSALSELRSNQLSYTPSTARILSSCPECVQRVFPAFPVVTVHNETAGGIGRFVATCGRLNRPNFTDDHCVARRRTQ